MQSTISFKNINSVLYNKTLDKRFHPCRVYDYHIYHTHSWYTSCGHGISIDPQYY